MNPESVIDISNEWPASRGTGTYLLNHSAGLPPVSTRSAVDEAFLVPWENGSTDLWNAWLQAIGGFTSAVADLLNTEQSQICPQVNLSSALTKILFSLPVNPSRNVVLLSESDFPSMGFVLDKARQRGHELRFIPAQEDVCDPDTWQRHLCNDVGLAFITHVHSNTSKQVPVSEVTAIARERGIISIVDIAQSVGVLPIDVQAWQSDFVIGTSLKWLCGGPGAGFLWLTDEMVQTTKPVDVGWFSHEQPLEFDIHNFEYAPSALRFWGGTPSVMPYVVAANSIRLMLDVGIEEVRRHNQLLSQKIIDAAGSNHLKSPGEPENRGGTVVVKWPEPQQSGIIDALKASDVRFDGRASGMRLSPHIYNTTQDIDTVVDIIASQ